MKHRKLFAVFLLNCAFVCAHQAAFANYPGLSAEAILTAEKFYRTELYFGMDKPKGGRVTGEEWNKFLADEVTPRFPDGFTVLEGYGQFKDAAGKIVREESKVLVLFYPKSRRKPIDQKIEQVRAVYKKQFEQESVLRLDFRKSVQISF